MNIKIVLYTLKKGASIGVSYEIDQMYSLRFNIMLFY